MLSEQVEFDLESMTTPSTRPTTRPQRTSGRIPYLVSTLLILGGALLASVSWANYDRTQQTLVLANDVAAGETITDQDLKVVRTKGVANRLESSAELVGEVANTDLAAGDIVVKADVVTSRQLEAGESVVGLTLNEGQYPSVGIKVGDAVSVISSVPGNEPQQIASQVEVIGVTKSSTGGINISLLTFEGQAISLAGHLSNDEKISLIVTGTP